MFADIATIDGPPAAGKTTMASLIAKELGLIHLDSGAIFRTITLHCMRTGVNFNNPDEIINSLNTLNIRVACEKVFLDEEDVSEEIRTVKVTNSVRYISHIPTIRNFVTSHQLSCAKNGGVITDGRKVGTEVFPNAKVKFFLTADQNVRAKRRFLQQQKTNPDICFEDVLSDLKRREEYEVQNNVLLVPENPIIIDNTNMTIEETLAKMVSYMV